MSEERLLHQWTEKPYTAHDKRRWAIEHRLVLQAHPSGADVVHEVRSDDDDSVPDEWVTAEAYEVRRGSINHVELTDREEVLRA